jgi:hypothetical protein
MYCFTCVFFPTVGNTAHLHMVQIPKSRINIKCIFFKSLLEFQTFFKQLQINFIINNFKIEAKADICKEQEK